MTHLLRSGESPFDVVERGHLAISVRHGLEIVAVCLSVEHQLRMAIRQRIVLLAQPA